MSKLHSGGVFVLASTLLLLAAAAPAQDRTDVPDFHGYVYDPEHDTTACPGPTCITHRLMIYDSASYGNAMLLGVVQRMVIPGPITDAVVAGVLYEPDKVKRDSKPQLQLKQSAQVLIVVQFATTGMGSVFVGPVQVDGCKALVKAKDDNENGTFESPGDKFKWKFQCPEDVLTAAPPNGLGLSVAQAQAFEKVWGKQKVDVKGGNP